MGNDGSIFIGSARYIRVLLIAQKTPTAHDTAMQSVSPRRQAPAADGKAPGMSLAPDPRPLRGCRPDCRARGRPARSVAETGPRRPRHLRGVHARSALLQIR